MRDQEIYFEAVEPNREFRIFLLLATSRFLLVLVLHFDEIVPVLDESLVHSREPPSDAIAEGGSVAHELFHRAFDDPARRLREGLFSRRFSSKPAL